MKLTHQIKIKELTRVKIVNILLYVIILIMPYIVTNVSGPKYVIGKVYLLYICTTFAAIVGIKFKDIKIKKENIIAIIFLITILISTIYSPYKEIAFWGNYQRREGFLMWTVYITLFILSNNYIIVNKSVIRAVIIVASFMAIYGVVQFYGYDPIQVWAIGSIKVNTSLGTIGNRNFFSSYICLFLFISTAIYILKNGKEYLICSTIMFAALLCSLTRSGWLAFICYSAMGFFFIIKRKNALKRAMLILIIFTCVYVTINITSNNKIEDRADKSIIVSEQGQLHGSVASRTNILRVSWNGFLDRPFLGTGPDTLKYRLLDNYPSEMLNHIKAYRESIDKAHNEFLELAVSCGLFTVTSYLVLITIILIPIIKNLKDDRCKILLLVIVGYLVQSFFNISVIMVAPLFWILLGYCVKVHGFTKYN